MTETINRNNSKTLSQINRHIEAEEALGHIPQPMFIIGSGGAGKTTLLAKLIQELESNRWEERVHFFDGKQFFNSEDIIQAIERSYERSTEEKRRIVIIDDIDFFFNRSSFDDQYALRSYLNREDAPLLIATASEVTSNLADYQAPFFEGVRVIYVPAVEIADAENSERMARLLKYLPPVVRSIKTASEIIALSPDPKNDLGELVRRGEALYRMRLENMPVNSQKILYALAKSSGIGSLTDLREQTGLPAGTLSTYIKMLTKSGDIRKTDATKRGAPYEINDKLFGLWLSGKYSMLH